MPKDSMAFLFGFFFVLLTIFFMFSYIFACWCECFLFWFLRSYILFSFLSLFFFFVVFNWIRHLTKCYIMRTPKLVLLQTFFLRENSFIYSNFFFFFALNLWLKSTDSTVGLKFIPKYLSLAANLISFLFLFYSLWIFYG